MLDNLWIMLQLADISDDQAADKIRRPITDVMRWKRGLDACPPQYQFLLFWSVVIFQANARRFYDSPDAPKLVAQKALVEGKKIAPNWRGRARKMIEEMDARISTELIRLGGMPEGAQSQALDMASRWGWFPGDKAATLRQILHSKSC